MAQVGVAGRGRQPRHTRERIAAAALAIADQEGLEAVSMRRIAGELGVGTMTLYYYVRNKEDLLTLVEDALMGEICDACDPLPKPWRAAITRLTTTTRDTYLRHAWALRSLTGLRVKPNGLRHVEQSLQAVASLGLPMGKKHQILSIVDDYVFGHCAGVMRRRSQPQLVRKTARALSQAMKDHLDAGDYPQLRAMIGQDDPVAAFVKYSTFMTDDAHFDIGLEALLEGLARRFRLK